jgi:hypothetical protein
VPTNCNVTNSCWLTAQPYKSSYFNYHFRSYAELIAWQEVLSYCRRIIISNCAITLYCHTVLSHFTLVVHYCIHIFHWCNQWQQVIIASRLYCFQYWSQQLSVMGASLILEEGCLRTCHGRCPKVCRYTSFATGLRSNDRTTVLPGKALSRA